MHECFVIVQVAIFFSLFSVRKRSSFGRHCATSVSFVLNPKCQIKSVYPMAIANCKENRSVAEL